MHIGESLWIIRCLLVGVLALPATVHSQESVPVDQQATILLKALSFDRNLTRRCPQGIHIAVLYIGDEKGPQEMAEAFNSAGKSGVRDLSVMSKACPFESVGELLEMIDRENINAIYIDPSIAIGISSVQQVTRAKKLPSFGSNKKQVEQGASLGVYMRDGAPKVVINLRASRVEGLRFGSGLLSISTVIR